MKKKHLFFLFLIPLFLILFFLVGKNSEEHPLFSVNVKGHFSISLPDFLHPAVNIDSSATLQYENEKERMFVLVYEIIPDSLSKQKSPGAFFETLAGEFVSRLERGTLLKFYPQVINGRNALIGNIRGTVNGTGLYYRIALVENENQFYEIITGTTESKQTAHHENMNKIIHSIRFPE